MAYTIDENACERRINAYTDFLMAAYDVDADGLADLIGASHEEMAEYVAADFRGKDAAILQCLGRLTGISFAWLFAEDNTN